MLVDMSIRYECKNVIYNTEHSCSNNEQWYNIYDISTMKVSISYKTEHRGDRHLYSNMLMTCHLNECIKSEFHCVIRPFC